MKLSIIIGIVLLSIAIVIYTQITIFLIQPIGAIPDGRTLVLNRGGNLNFIDSADALCLRAQGKVNLLCRAATIAQVSREFTIYARLPYSETLYLISTDGAHYDR